MFEVGAPFKNGLLATLCKVKKVNVGTSNNQSAQHSRLFLHRIGNSRPSTDLVYCTVCGCMHCVVRSKEFLRPHSDFQKAYKGTCELKIFGYSSLLKIEP